ncbi:MAG: hypothetical protein MMC23_002453 [Stictis urceolatum]|nr:hypothetical protein [Stictis urceolata]
MKEPGNEYRFVPEILVSFLELVHPIAFSPFSSIWVWLKPRGLDWIFENTKPEPLKKWTLFVDGCLVRRTEAEEALQNNPDSKAASRKDFFHYLFKAVDPETGEKGYHLDELYSECENLIIAGSDTTSVVFAAMFFYLARNLGVQATLTKEILSAFPSSIDIESGSQLRSCKYLRAFLYEAMRMAPPVGAELFREVLSGGMAVDGEFFPEGVNVSTCLYAHSYDKDIRPEPFKFKPERWIVDDGEKMGSSADNVALAESAFCSFSTGSRGCVGKNLALLEISIVIAKVMYQLQIRPDENDNLGAGDPNGKPGRQRPDQFQLYDALVAVRHGPMVQSKKRSPA